MDWQPIETAPKDGRRVYVKRVYEDKKVREGWAVFGIAAANAPIRQPIEPDPLGRLSRADYAREQMEILDYANHAKWLTEDRMYSFPTPTHWSPAPPQGDAS